MCNLYSFIKSQQAILEATREMVDGTGNLPLLPGICPDYAAPIVRAGAGGVQRSGMRSWNPRGLTYYWATG